MNEARQLLETSIRSYQNLLEHVSEFKQELDEGKVTAEQINVHNERLKELQARVEMSDLDFMEYFNDKAALIMADAVLMQKRANMMQEIMKLNDFLLPRLASLINITHDELTKLKASINKISGCNADKSDNG